jgi:hypothetical protein
MRVRARIGGFESLLSAKSNISRLTAEFPVCTQALAAGFNKTLAEASDDDHCVAATYEHESSQLRPNLPTRDQKPR